MNSPLLQQAVEALKELHEAHLTKFPPAMAGSAAQTEWSERRANAHDRAEVVIAALESAIQQQPEAVPATLPESISRDEMLRYYSEYANMVANEVTGYQKQIRDLKAALQQQEGKGEAMADRLLRGLVNHWNEFGPEHGLDEMMDAAHRYTLATSPSTAVQQEAGSGWRLVPVEPTQAMLDAADKFVDSDPRFVSAAYRAMLVAAPVVTPQPEVTEAMKQAGVQELFRKDMEPKPDAWEEKIARIYCAMLAAAPTQQPPSVSDGGKENDRG